MMSSFLEPWTVHTRHEIRLIRNFQWITWLLLLFIIAVVTNSTPCNHFQEYNTCVLSCYLQEPFTWLQESKRADRTTTKTSLSTSRLKMNVTCFPTNPTYGKKKTQVINTAHSAISYFITGLSPTCMFVCAWENTLIKVFVGSNDQQWLSICVRSTLPTPGWISACLHYQ